MTRGDIENPRRHGGDAIIKVLEERGWVDVVGHRDTPGARRCLQPPRNSSMTSACAASPNCRRSKIHQTLELANGKPTPFRQGGPGKTEKRSRLTPVLMRRMPPPATSRVVAADGAARNPAIRAPPHVGRADSGGVVVETSVQPHSQAGAPAQGAGQAGIGSRATWRNDRRRTASA